MDRLTLSVSGSDKNDDEGLWELWKTCSAVFQGAVGAAARPRSRKRPVLHTLHSIQTLRFVLFHRAGLLVRPQGKLRLRLTDNPATRALYTRIGAALARAA